MNEMIERVARALFLAEHPDAEWSAGRARMKWFALAEDAVKAMREPTEAMLEAGPGDPYLDAHVWSKILDAALKD